MEKKTASLTIYGRLDGLNEYTRACRSNKYEGAAAKRKNERLIMGSIAEQLQGVHFGKPVKLVFKWYEPNRRRDLDNVSSAKKFIQDALVKSGVLEGDGWRHIAGFIDEFYVDKGRPRIEVIISEV